VKLTTERKSIIKHQILMNKPLFIR